MTKIAIIGGGIIGAAIAYELSKLPHLNITLIDQQTPATGSTGAALGVLMGVISRKTKGRAWQLRQTSMNRYDSLITELESLTNIPIPYNRQGIVMLCYTEPELEKWQKLLKIRASQGQQLSIWSPQQLQSQCPHLSLDNIIAAIYSPGDRQVNPTILTQALITAATLHGVNSQLGVTVENILPHPDDNCYQINSNKDTFMVNKIVLAAGLGSTPLTASLNSPLDIRPVLGQAIHLKLPQPLGNPHFQPVITANDVHLVSLGKGEYWLGATVEFPDETEAVIAQASLLEQMRQQAIAFCPTIAQANIISTWSGKRPRPQGQSAPLIGKLPGYDNILFATGHYRNGVLLAPATAIAIRDILMN